MTQAALWPQWFVPTLQQFLFDASWARFHTESLQIWILVVFILIGLLIGFLSVVSVLADHRLDNVSSRQVGGGCCRLLHWFTSCLRNIRVSRRGWHSSVSDVVLCFVTLNLFEKRALCRVLPGAGVSPCLWHWLGVWVRFVQRSELFAAYVSGRMSCGVGFLMLLDHEVDSFLSVFKVEHVVLPGLLLTCVTWVKSLNLRQISHSLGRRVSRVTYPSLREINFIVLLPYIVILSRLLIALSILCRCKLLGASLTRYVIQQSKGRVLLLAKSGIQNVNFALVTFFQLRFDALVLNVFEVTLFAVLAAERGLYLAGLGGLRVLSFLHVFYVLFVEDYFLDLLLVQKWWEQSVFRWHIEMRLRIILHVILQSQKMQHLVEHREVLLLLLLRILLQTPFTLSELRDLSIYVGEFTLEMAV